MRNIALSGPCPMRMAKENTAYANGIWFYFCRPKTKRSDDKWKKEVLHI